jgi:hypothetical protein
VAVHPDLPDVTDPDIRAMVLRNHQPAETWIGKSETSAALVIVRCATCWQPWPCPSILAARAAEPPPDPLWPRRRH